MTAKEVLKWKFSVKLFNQKRFQRPEVLPETRKERTSQILGKQKEGNVKIAEISEVESRNSREKSVKQKHWFSGKNTHTHNKIDKSQDRMIKKKDDTNYQCQKMRKHHYRSHRQ